MGMELRLYTFLTLPPDPDEVVSFILRPPYPQEEILYLLDRALCGTQTRPTQSGEDKVPPYQ